MPKRTNEFQILIRHIYESMSHIEGGSVTESAMVKDRNGIEREVDVFVELESFGHKLNIAIEVRDRARLDDIQWIDSLIGKYQDLSVNKIIAVSKSGFTSAARNKAISNGIEPVTLEEFDEINWPDKISKINIGEFKLTYNLVGTRFYFNPEIEGEIGSDVDIYGENDSIVTTVGDLVFDLLESHVYRLANDQFEKEYMPLEKDINELKKNKMVSVSIEPKGLYILSPSGERHIINGIIYFLTGITSLEEKPLKRYMFGDKIIVSQAIIKEEDVSHKFDIIQVKGSTKVSINYNRFKR